jgi:2-polyprenyl-6-methoxyphenol hydroxylase-like FAD-dependent oxidoreductase
MKDPTTGFGIADAFRDAGLLATALDDTLAGRVLADEALAGYQSRRDQAAIPLYEMTLKMASGEMAGLTEATLP